MKRYDKLIFVCTGNTALSPMAEAIMQEKFRLEDILIESRGLVVLFPEPINPKVEAILASRGLSMKDYVSVPLTRDDFDERTLILTMDLSQKEKLLGDHKNAQNVYTLAEYIGAEDIKDPYGGSVSDYGHCFDALEEHIDALAEKMRQEDY